MPDAHTPQQRSYNMSRIRSSGTAPERRLGDLLRTMFPTAELIERPQDLPGRPDWWLPELKLALFADGCFFHRCPRHYIAPANNKEYWAKKIAGNHARDRRINKELSQRGILPVRIWEHDLRKDTTAARRKIRRVLRQRTLAELEAAIANAVP